MSNVRSITTREENESMPVPALIFELFSHGDYRVIKSCFFGCNMLRDLEYIHCCYSSFMVEVECRLSIGEWRFNTRWPMIWPTIHMAG